jgi:hypothetical protein
MVGDRGQRQGAAPNRRRLRQAPGPGAVRLEEPGDVSPLPSPLARPVADRLLPCWVQLTVCDGDFCFVQARQLGWRAAAELCAEQADQLEPVALHQVRVASIFPFNNSQGARIMRTNHSILHV